MLVTDDQVFVCGRPTEGGFSLWARNPEGRLAMTAEVNLA
jgi:hypothetical protein